VRRENKPGVDLMPPIDWRGMFVPSANLVEFVLRASLMQLLILAGFRVFRRDAGSRSMSDLLVAVPHADAGRRPSFVWNDALDGWRLIRGSRPGCSIRHPWCW
jgi:hypothetical protein